MLDVSRTQQMTDVIHASILYSGIEKEIIGTPIYNRLHRILQNSMVYLTYPSNKVKRFEHSIGTMHIAGEIFYHSMCNAKDDVLKKFFKEISKIMVSWRKEIKRQELNFVKSNVSRKYEEENIMNLTIPESNLYKGYMPGNIIEPKYRLAYLVVFQAIRLAGLLHDVGHLPYSHVLEHAFQYLYKKVDLINKEERYKRQEQFLEVMRPYCVGDEIDEIHENIGKLLVDQIYANIVESLPKMKEDGIFFAMTFYFAKRILESKSGDGTIFTQLHAITAGTVDADRLDYCTRDSYCAGLNMGKFNYDRFIKTYTLMIIKPQVLPGESRVRTISEFCFCPAAKTNDQIEELLKRRWDIFINMNFHHRVHKHEILLSEVIVDLGFEELKSNDPFDKPLDDVLPLDISSIWRLIGALTSNKELGYQIIQLDDSWIDTLLRNKFFSKYSVNYYNLDENGNSPEWNRFEELISAKKRYFTLIKRSNDFRVFDENLYKCLKERIKEIEDSFVNYKDIELFQDKPNQKIDYAEFCNKKQSFCWNYFRDIIFDFKEEFYFEVEKGLNSLTDEQKEEIGAIHFLVRKCEFKTGVSEAKYPVHLCNKGKAVPLSQISNIGANLKWERRLIPLFHVYYLPIYNNSDNDFLSCNESKLYDVLAKNFAEVLIKKLKEQISAIKNVS